MKDKRKKELKEEIAKLDKEYKSKEKEIKLTKEYTDLETERKNLEKEKENIDKKIDKTHEEINEKYLDSGNYPYWQSGEYGSKNIRNEVLNSIKRSLGIKNLSLLKGSDIEKITRELIEKEKSSNKELSGLWNKREKNEERIEEMEKKQGELREEAEDIYEKSRVLNQELYRIEEMEKKAEELKDTKKVAYKKRWEAKERAEKELKQNFKKIVEEVRIGVIKEKIVNELEDNNEEN